MTLGQRDARGLAGRLAQRGDRHSTARFQIVNALIWAATVMGSAVVVKASDELTYLLLVLLSGSICSSTAVLRLLGARR